MPDNFDQLGGLVDRIFGRASAHSRMWVAVWLAAILVVTAIAAISHAPPVAYVILVIVAGTAIYADGSSGGSA